MKKYYLGIDCGSTTIKAVLIDSDRKIINSLYKRTKPAVGRSQTCIMDCGRCGTCGLGEIKNTISDFLNKQSLSLEDIKCTAVTGSQIVEEFKSVFDYDLFVSEVTAHIAGAQSYYPSCEAILDVGGQDSKAMVYDKKVGIWKSKMCGVCAAGTGAFLDNIAVKLDVPVEKMSEIASLESDLEFSSVCAVFGATSINKFKNKYPLKDIVAAACKAQARTILSSVGELFNDFKGDLIFQGGVAANGVVVRYLELFLNKKIKVPEHHKIIGAIGAASLAKEYDESKKKKQAPRKLHADNKLKSSILRTKIFREEIMALKSGKPVIWTNLFFPMEILNAFSVVPLILEKYATIFTPDQKDIRYSLDNAALQGYSAETCSFLRVLMGKDLPVPSFCVSTTQPCGQADKMMKALVEKYEITDKYYSLQISSNNDKRSIEYMAEQLEEAVHKLEIALGQKLDIRRLEEAFEHSNEARRLFVECKKLQISSPPLLRGTTTVFLNTLALGQLWGRKEAVELLQQLYEDLLERKQSLTDIGINDTHRLLWIGFPPFYNKDLIEYIDTKCNAPIISNIDLIEYPPLDINNPFYSLAKHTVIFQRALLSIDLKEIEEKMKLANFNGAVLYNHMFGRCEIFSSMAVNNLKKITHNTNTSFLILDGDCIDETINPVSTKTKVKAFVEALNKKKYGTYY